MFNQFDSLLDLTDEKKEWSICVRAQVIWQGINQKTNEFRGYNVIFIDNQNCRIHAFISEKVCARFKEQLQEGHLYQVSRFSVKHYEGAETHRAVRNKKHIYFESNTHLEVLNENVGNVEPYAFDLFALADVENFVTDERFLIDVVGLLDSVSINCICKEDTAKSHLKFKISDGRYKVNVTFFNELGENFQKAFSQMGEDKVVVIISSAKVHKYDGETYLSNFPATRFYLNPNHYSVEKLLKSVAMMDCEPVIDSKLYIIEEIKNLTKEYTEKDVLCHVTVKKVEEEMNWYANYCTGCGEEITKVDGRFRCQGKDCNRIIPYPDKRFRLCTICTDKSGILPIIFPDDEVQRIIGKDAFDIANDDTQVGEGITFPPLLKQFEKKDYILTLMPSLENINKSSKIYIAKKLGNPEEMLGEHDPDKELTPMLHTVSVKTETFSEKHSKCYSPPTGKSSNRTRVNKNKTPVKYADYDCPLTKLKKS